MSWLDKLVPSLGGMLKRDTVPQGLWISCPGCEQTQSEQQLEESLHVCPLCGYHIRIGARQRLEYFLDTEDRQVRFDDIATQDKLKFVDTKPYPERIKQAKRNSGENEALVVMTGRLKGMPVCMAAFEFRFMGGSMGAVVGKRFQMAVDYSIEHRAPLICFATSGGARMQESMLSLVQMARTAAALKRMSESGVPYISVLVDPVYGGVSASLGILGDINIAEPGALVGFTGPRVIEQNIRVKLPEGFQRSEFLLEYGAIDMIVPRQELRGKIYQILEMLMPGHD